MGSTPNRLFKYDSLRSVAFSAFFWVSFVLTSQPVILYTTPEISHETVLSHNLTRGPTDNGVLYYVAEIFTLPLRSSEGILARLSGG